MRLGFSGLDDRVAGESFDVCGFVASDVGGIVVVVDFEIVIEFGDDGIVACGECFGGFEENFAGVVEFFRELAGDAF